MPCNVWMTRTPGTSRGAAPAEVEQAFANDPLVVLSVQKRSGEERVLCAGLTDAGRALQFVYTMRSGRVRVVTAHMAKRNVREEL